MKCQSGLSHTHKPHKEHQAITQLMNTLKQINLNQSLKQQSIKFHKTKTTHLHQPTVNNLMTEQDLDQLFHKSKEKDKQKGKIRTQAHQVLTNHTNNLHNIVSNNSSKLTKKNNNNSSVLPSPSHHLKKDYANTKFLRMDNQYDKLLTGLPQSHHDKQNMGNVDQGDLTAKFKKDYIIGKVIGQGAYASVRVAVYRPENKKIAIKAYEKIKIRQPVRKRTIKRQIKILQMINHRNIVKILDVVQSNNHLNIIMQYLPGIALSQALKQQPSSKFSQNHCRSIMKQLTNAVMYLHQKNIAHRDIKLENIIVHDQVVKVIDFGFSTCIEKNTKIKIFCGTPSYMAPQIVQKIQYRGQAADIWALGVMMFVMLMGYFPYKGNSDQQLYRKINHAQYPLTDILHLKKAHHLIHRMFTIDPAQRITASQVLNHPWMTDSPLENTQEIQRKSSKGSAYELRRLYSSKQKSSSKDPRDFYRDYQPKERDSYSKKKKSTQKSYVQNLNKTHKTLSGKLTSSNSRQPKFQKTMGNPLRQEKSPTNSNAAQNRIKIMDFLKFQLKRCSESLSPVRRNRP